MKGGFVTDESKSHLERKGWDGSVKCSSKTDMIVQFSVGSDDSLTGKLAAQDDNATHSNKSI